MTRRRALEASAVLLALAVSLGALAALAARGRPEPPDRPERAPGPSVPAAASPPEGKARPPGPPPALKPRPLLPGDTVLLLAPASPARSVEIEEASSNLRRQGFQVKVAPQAVERDGYLAGSDEARAAALNAGFADPEVRLILCLRGGYGSPRLLDRLDYDLIRRQPKLLLGYSDITALLLAIQKRTGLLTIHGPIGKDFGGRAGLSPFAEEHLSRLIGPRALGPDAFPAAGWGSGAAAGAEPRRTIAGGAAEGPLLGGNLSTVSALLGTPYEIDTRGAILFLEDVNEEPFRIDRMLNQLRLSGKLEAARGVLLGGFTRCTARTPQESLTVEEVLERCLGGLGIPVLGGFPAGHLPEQAALPIGLRVRLDASAQTLTLLEPAVEVPEAAPPPEGARGTRGAVAGTPGAAPPRDGR